MASAQQLIGLVKSHAEGNAERFFDLAMQLACAEDQKGHKKLAEQLRTWAEAGASRPDKKYTSGPTPIITPQGELSELLSADYPRGHLCDVILSETVENELKQLVTETRHTEKLESKGLKPRKRLLLSGPPGTGKTMTANSLAGELHYPLFKVQLHGLITKYMGETAQKLRMIFDAIHSTRGVYLFDEIDALAAKRANENDVGEARRILNSFLQFLDEDTGPSIIIATTNLPEILDRAILRRFELVLSYDLPDALRIEKAIKRRLLDFNITGINWTTVSQKANGLSTADVIAASEDAARRAVIDDSAVLDTNMLITSLNQRRLLLDIGSLNNETRTQALSTESRKIR